MTGTLFQTPVLLVNVYSPNWGDIEFMNRLLSCLQDLNTHKLTFERDLNLVLNPLLDRSNPKNGTISKMSKSLSAFIEDNGCVDPWRSLNPLSKSFSFYSHVPQVFSRMDCFFYR